MALIQDKFRYDAETGKIYVRETGREAGWSNGVGYLKVDFERKKYYVHRLAWFIANGEWADEIDHINGDRSDNRLCNLRACSKNENARNSPKRAHSNQPYKGIRITKGGRWSARIRHLKKEIYLGTFDKPEEAYEEYIFAAINLHGEFARLD